MKRVLFKLANAIVTYFSYPVMYDSKEGRDIFIPHLFT